MSHPASLTLESEARSNLLADPGVIPGGGSTDQLVLASRNTLTQAFGERDGAETLRVGPLSDPGAELLCSRLESVVLEGNDTRVSTKSIEL
jgi:hypothetical protein